MSELQNLSPVDRISNLPDSLLCHILSFLSTKEVVATSILSSRWTTLWTHVPCLRFKYFEYSTNYRSDQDDDDDDDDHKVHNHDHREKRISFTYFVYRVLTLLKAPTVETFRLECKEEIDPLHVNTWICAALGRGVKELDLSYYCSNKFKLPRSAFTGESLVVLKLNELDCRNCPSYIHLPSLKILHTGKVFCEYHNKDAVGKLISSCPILEELDVERELRYETTFNISIPTLKSLQVHISEALPESKVQISTPSLVKLYIGGGTCTPDYLLNKVPNLVEARVFISVENCDENYDDFEKYGENYGDFVLKLLRGLYNVKILYFSTITHRINIPFDDLPLFRNLVKLILKVHSFECNVLKTLLENSPNLKVLDINKALKYILKYIFQGEGPVVYESCWSQPSHGPGCLSHLETFFVGCSENFDDLEFVKYILKNAQVLVKATVFAHCSQGLEGQFNFLKKLSMFPRGSKTCQLAFC